MKIGYCCVSTDDQNPEAQFAALKQAGYKKIVIIESLSEEWLVWYGTTKALLALYLEGTEGRNAIRRIAARWHGRA